MKPIRILALCAISITCVSCQLANQNHQNQSQKNLTVRTTAYTHNERDHIKYGRLTAIGTKLKSLIGYTSAASDWSFLPVGTTFTIKGQPTKYVIDDYGSALVGTKTIDIYCPSRRSMNTWGVRTVDICVDHVGDYSRSLSILSERRKYPHIRKMVASIRQKHEIQTVEG